MRKQLSQNLEANARFEPGEVRSQAEVDAVTEGDVIVRPTIGIELVGTLEVPRVAIRSREDHHQHIVLADLLSLELQVCVGRPRQAVDRGVEPQEFVDHGRDLLGLLPRHLEQIGPLLEHDGHIRQQVGRGLVASVPEKLTEPDELVGLCQLLWNAGNETTTNLLSNVAVVLQQRPDLLEMAGKQPQKIPAMVDEFLRLHTPINCLARTANADLEFQGQKIRQDDVLMVIFAAANRDPRHFERADEFDPDRRPNDHVAFSHGIHFCLGSHLARLEARVGLEVLGELLPHVRIQTDRGARIPTGLLRGWLTLPLEPA